MKSQIAARDWNSLQTEGHVRIPAAFGGSALAKLDAAVQSLLVRYPHGFVNPPIYSSRKPEPRQQAPKTTDRAPTVIIPNVGFLEPELLEPLANPFVYDLLERIVGKDFYLSNTWFQMVPPGTGRLAYHKDPRGSVTFNILLDDIMPKMGSTCLVPGSHVNTPPPSFCMNNIQMRHGREVDMVGNAGDLVLFSAETWHGRSENVSDRWTRRLFYNFFSRSSRLTTAWNGVVDQSQLAAARAILPPEYSHMFRIDPNLTQLLSKIEGTRFRKWGLGKSSSNRILRDIVYAKAVYGRPAESDHHPGYLLPFTTRLVEAVPFSATQYMSHIKPLPALKHMVSIMRGTAPQTA